MRCLLRQLSSRVTAAIFSRATSFLASRDLYVKFSAPGAAPSRDQLSNLRPLESTSFSVRFKILRFPYSSSSSSSSSSPPGAKRRSRSRKTTELKPAVMDEEKDAFFVVRKGDIIGVYKNLTECQAQVGSSVRDPPVSVFKGYSLPKDAEDQLSSSGLQNALYTIRAQDWKEGMFGKLEPCLFQEPESSSENQGLSKNLPQKRPCNAVESERVDSSSHLQN